MKNLLKLLTLLVLCVVLPKVAHAGAVLEVQKAKKTVVVEGSADDGFVKGATVCIFDGSKKISCGKIKKSKGNKAYVAITKKLKSIKKDMDAQVDGDAGGSSVAKTIDIRLAFIYALSAPSTFKLLDLDTSGQDTSGASSAWVQNSDAAAATAFSGEVVFPLAGVKFGLGFRHMDRTYTANMDYNVSQPSEYLAFTHTEASNAVMINVYFAHIAMGPATIELGAGLDVDMSSLTVNIEHKSDTSSQVDTVFSGSGSLQTISLAASPTLIFPIGPVGLFFGLKLLLPLSGSSSGMAGDAIVDKQVLAGISDGTDPNEDLNTSLGYKKNSYALMVNMGGAVMF